MSVRVGSGLSTGADPRAAAIEAAMQARAGLDGRPADLVATFVSGSHLAAPEAVLEGIHEALEPAQLVGCGAGGVLGSGREIEGGTGVSVWAGSFDGGQAEAFCANVAQLDDHVVVSDVPDCAGADAVVLLPDPYSFPVAEVLATLGSRAPTVPVLGGIASARTGNGDAALLFGEQVVVDGGAVGVRFEGVEVLPCVSQGATPVGPELTITAAEGHVVSELAGEPALAKLREVVLSLSEEERRQVGGGLLVGLVVGPPRPEFERGDFLVRGLVGADPQAGTLTVADEVEPGQILRLHARDADSADADLREALELRRTALGTEPAGSLLFSCNGRGRAMFGTPDHDARALGEALGGPSAGFFAAGEIGPVAGENYLHGFTATLAIFPA
jgi:small ligand-binding sensory domain FIST